MLRKLNKYKNFVFSYTKLLSFIKRSNIETSYTYEKTHAPIFVVVTPWIGTAVPWFSAVLALSIAKKIKGVSILVDDLVFGNNKTFYRFQVYFIKRLLLKFSYLDTLYLSDYYSSESAGCDVGIIHNLARLNSIHFTKGESNEDKRREYEDLISGQLLKNYKAYNNFFSINSCKKIIFPGGIWGNSGLLSYFSKLYDIQAITFDGPNGLLLLSLNGTAAQLKDIPMVFNIISVKENERQFAIKKGVQQLESRRKGNDQHSFFNKDSKVIMHNNYYLIMLNSVWDSAALGLHTVYNSMLEWVLDTIDWILKNSSGNVIIRQHPVERLAHINNTDNYKKKILDRFPDNERVIFIDAFKDISSYDLIDNSKCVLGFSSTSIVEAVILKKPAIIVSDVYYSDLGIVNKSTNKKSYYTYLNRAENNKLNVTPDQHERACILNYITQSCNWIKTDFTSSNSDFTKWVKRDFDTISNSLAVQAIIENTPSSLLNHNKLFTEENRSC